MDFVVSLSLMLQQMCLMDFVVAVSLMLQQMCCLWFYLLNGGTLKREPLVMGQIGIFL